MSPLLKKVEKAGIKGIKKKRKPYQIVADDFFHETETLRLLFSELINNQEPNRVCLIPSVSYGIANVTSNLPFDSGKILVVDEQFPSNVYPWLELEERGFTLEVVKAPASENRGQSWNEAILESIDATTRVVALGHVHWADGSLFDLKSIRKKLDEVGGLLIIDGTQSVGALPFDVQEFRPDALICAGYKWLMGPYSIGYAYYGSKFDQGTPIEQNWINRKNSQDFSGLVTYEPDYQELALRYEVGEHSNFILVPMLHAALKQLLKWNASSIQTYCSDLIADSIAELTSIGYVVDDPRYRASHLFGIRLGSNTKMQSVKDALLRNKVSVSFRGDVIRVSPHVYNDEMDMRKLVKALKQPIFAS